MKDRKDASQSTDFSSRPPYVVSEREAVAAARARVAADKLRGATTDPRIVELASRKAS